MPTPKYHICLSHDVNQKLNLRYEEDELLIGSILPDETFTEHYLSHFQNKEGIGNETLPNIETFENSNELKEAIRSESILAGYKIHLLSDKFFNEYFNNEFESLKANELKVKKHNDTFKYERYLLLKNLSKINLNEEVLDKIEDTNVIKFNKDALKDMINSYNKDISKSKFVRVLKSMFYSPKFELTSKVEMDKLYSDLVDYIYKNMK